MTISKEEKDKALPEKLKGELPGILNWALRGCLDWQKGGLGEPDEVRPASDAYRAEQDTGQAFINECCHVHPEAKVTVSALFDAYGKWSGHKLTSRREFNKHMEAKKFKKNLGTGGYIFWHGIGLLTALSETLFIRFAIKRISLD